MLGYLQNTIAGPAIILVFNNLYSPLDGHTLQFFPKTLQLELFTAKHCLLCLQQNIVANAKTLHIL